MSLQLVLYPQNHEGYSSTSSAGPALEYIVDGINFSTINSSDAITNSGTLADILTAQPPNIVNTWYRARENAAVAYPTSVTNSPVLDFNSVSAGKYTTYVYQRLDNLTVGQIYTVTVNFQATNTSGAGLLTVLNGTTIQGIQGASVFYGYGITQVTTTFTAETTQDIFIFTWEDDINNDLFINDISVTTAVVSPSGVYTDLIDGQVICDLYEEEDIPLTLSMDEFKNVAEQVKSYSKDFNLPATKRNNRIFNNMFEVTRTDDGLIFNPQVVTKCVLKQDGFIIFEGFLRMTDIKDKEGEISYNVNLYSEVVALAEVLGERTFDDLSFSELEHSYTISNIQDSWESTGAGDGLTLTNPLPTTSFAYDSVTGVDNTQVLKYPFVDWNHQLVVGTNGPTLANLESAFRPFIQLKYLINKIFAGTNQFTYTSAFFDSAEFEKLFMDFNWGGNENGASPTYIGHNNRESNLFPTYSLPSDWTAVPFDLSVSGSSALWSTVTDRFTSPVNNLNFFAKGKIEALCVLPGYVEMRFAHYDVNGNFIQEWGYKKELMIIGFTATLDIPLFSTLIASGDYIQGETKRSSLSSFQLRDTSYFNMNWISFGAQTSNFLTETRGELGQWEFLKGIITMFNLVSTVDKDNPNNILIEPYVDMFFENTNSGNTSNLTLAARSIEHDWTDKVDVSQMELKPLIDLDKTTTFQFAEDNEDYIFGVYKEANYGLLYGSESFDASLSASGLNTLFKGTKEITVEPFAASVVAPLDSAYLDFVVPRIYTRGEDGVTASFDNIPRILYNNGVHVLAINTYKVLAQNGDVEKTLNGFLQFSHLSEIPSVSATSTNYYFNNQSLVSSNVGVPPIDDLYTTYWSPYINELYNADTRTMTLRVNLNSSDIASFKFYDTVMIKNRSFRVNYIDYKPNSLAKVEFILLP
jgi:hypothetical protein